MNCDLRTVNCDLRTVICELWSVPTAAPCLYVSEMQRTMYAMSKFIFNFDFDFNFQFRFSFQFPFRFWRVFDFRLIELCQLVQCTLTTLSTCPSCSLCLGHNPRNRAAQSVQVVVVVVVMPWTWQNKRKKKKCWPFAKAFQWQLTPPSREQEREGVKRRHRQQSACVCACVCGGERKTASMSAANRRSIFVCRHSPSTCSPSTNRSYQHCPARTVQRTRNLKSNNFDTNHYLNTKYQIQNVFIICQTRQRRTVKAWATYGKHWQCSLAAYPGN